MDKPRHEEDRKLKSLVPDEVCNPVAVPGMEPGQVKDAHPRDRLLQDLSDQEQRLLDKLHLLRQLRDEYMWLSREEANRVLMIINRIERLRY